MDDNDDEVGTLFQDPPKEDEERNAFERLNPAGFFIRHPPQPHELNTFQTPDELLFQTIHMGAAQIATDKWTLVVTGLVDRPFSIDLNALRKLPSKTITSFHECYGSPLVPPTKALRRIGNVTWTGVPLQTLLARAGPQNSATFVWSEGLDRGAFGGIEADRYQKDLPLEKALAPEVLVAYEMNSRPLKKKRGGPVRLVVPGWFGTNSTKWLSKISLQTRRAPGHFTTTFYNETIPGSLDGQTRPVWKAQPNSMIVKPSPEAVLDGPDMTVEGWAWSHDGVERVKISPDGGETWMNANVVARTEFSWQRFHLRVSLSPGHHTLISRATSKEGESQPLTMARNHVHRVTVEVV